MEVLNEETEISEVDQVETPDSEETTEHEEISEEQESSEDETEGREGIEASDEGDEETEISEPAEKYDPDFSYQVLDDKYEMPEHLRKYITSPEDEAAMRDLVARAHGLEVVKEDRQVLRDENTNLAHIEQTRQQAVTQMTEMVKNGDLKPFLDAWGIPEEKLFQYVNGRLELANMDPHQRAEYERSEQARIDSYFVNQQNQTLQQHNTQLQGQALAHQVDMTLSSPEFSEAASAYDKVQGVGAFRSEVGKLGEYYYLTQNGKMVPPEQLAKEVANRVNWQGQQQQQEPQSRVPPSQRVVERNRRPTLPKVRGSGNSPVRKSHPKSIADLKKLAASMG